MAARETRREALVGGEEISNERKIQIWVAIQIPEFESSRTWRRVVRHRIALKKRTERIKSKFATFVDEFNFDDPVQSP